MAKKLNLKTISIAVALAVMPVSAIAMTGAQNWPVHDSTISEKFDALGAHFSNLIQSDKTQSQISERNVIAQNLNQNTLAVMEDQKKVILQAAPSLQKCIAITNSLGAGNMSGAVNQTREAITRSLSQVVSAKENENLNSVTKSAKDLKTCTAEDVQMKVGGCTVEGKYANMDANSYSIKVNVLNGSYSLPPEQLAVAQQYIKNVVYAKAPASLDLGRGANSEVYNAHKKLWYARASAVENALAFQAAEAAGIDLSKNASARAMWNSPSMLAAYEMTHNGKKPPEKPSMIEIINTLVLKDMFYSNSEAENQASSELELLRSLNKKQALTNYLMFRNGIINTLHSDQTGMIVMNQLAPITNDIKQTAQAGY